MRILVAALLLTTSGCAPSSCDATGFLGVAHQAAVTPPGLLEVARTAPALGGAIGSLELVSASCTTSEVAVSTAQGFLSLECWNMTATPVYLGPTGVTTTTGRPVCTDASACPSSNWPADVTSAAGLYCIAGSAVTLRCLAGRP